MPSAEYRKDRNRFYGPWWQKARRAHLAKHPLCAWHLEKGEVVAAQVVHHKIPHRGNERLLRDPKNFESLCKTCHDSTAQAAERNTSAGVDIEGYPIDGSW